jgi:hypothetical protein
VTGCSVRDPRIRPQAGLPTRNFFAPLRTDMELEGTKEEADDGEYHEPSRQAASHHPNFCNKSLTVSETNQRHRQRQF